MYFGSTKILEVDYDKQEKDNLIYQWNRQMDFNEWFNDVYIVSNNNSGEHTIEQLWDLFEVYEDQRSEKQETKTLLLKWGDIHGGDFGNSPEALSISNKLDEVDEKNIDERKKLACEVIDLFNGEVYSWWEGRNITKEEGKEYIMNYKNN